MAKINLDALLPREDFETVGNKFQNAQINQLSVRDLISPVFYQVLRKPDFQRETNEWDSKKIVEFIESFLEGDLIPSIILWRSESGLIFVIDGAHRLSALISWIYDDYGDGKISKEFYENDLPADQIKYAHSTRNLINKRIGGYQDIEAASLENASSADYIKKSNNIAVNAVQVQWVSGNAQKAEHSFFNINQKASKIDRTELKLLESRKKANCISARAIIRGGKGHKYWSNFSAENQAEIQRLSREIHEILFTPQLTTPVKTMDIPIGGKVSSAQTLPLILEFVNQVNNVPKEFKDTLNDDSDGGGTVTYLKVARKIAWRINSVHASSLGLHPIIYFYSREGKYKSASFNAITSFVLELIRQKKLKEFVEARSEFENFILNSDYVTQQINRKYRSASKGLPHIIRFYFSMLENINQGYDYKTSINQIVATQEFNYIVLTDEVAEGPSNRSNFDNNSKAAVFINEALQNGIKCKICRGLIHKNSITIDHVQKKEEGGLGTLENGQLAHPYCNTTFKN